ncbi:uncharacterized protein TNCV_2433551 [Trichonephila clavipes]|nr:uncharacterized protein TNCV_2433551 [Trichonephila clavipes]
MSLIKKTNIARPSWTPLFAMCIYNEEPKNWYRHAYANKDIWNQTDYGAAVGKAYIRYRLSGIAVRCVTAATMAGYQDLSEFKRGVIERWDISSPRYR